MFIGIGLGLIPQAMTGSSVDALLGGNSLDNYGKAAFLFDVPRSQYRNGTTQVGSFSSLTGLTFTRALAAYAPNSAGVLQLFASGAPRITDRGLLIEGARTNLCVRSQEFDNASWAKAGAGVASAPTVTADYGIAPDGTQTADRVQFALNGGTATADISSITSANMTGVTSSVYASSFWIKSNTAFTYTMQMRDIAGNPVSLTVTPTWQRVSGIATAGGTSLNQGIRLRGGQTPTNSDSADILLWQAQCELGGFISSEIPTTTASVTRPADVCSIAVSGISYPATLFAEFERVVDTGGNESLLALDSGSGNDEAFLGITSSDRGRLFSETGSTLQADITDIGAAMSLAVSYKLAGRFGASDFQGARGGSLGTPDVSGTAPGSPTRLLIGARDSSVQPLFGFIKRAAVWNSAFTDSQLQGVTS